MGLAPDDYRLTALETQTELKLDALRAMVQELEASRRREGEAFLRGYLEAREIERQRLEGVIEGVRLGAHKDVERLMEVKNLHWHEHAQTHQQLEVATHAATVAMDKRLFGMNEFRTQMTDMSRTFVTKEAIDKLQVALEGRLGRHEEDTRRRFEVGDKEQRSALRPLEDANAGRMAIIAALVVAVGLIVAAVTIVNFIAARAG